MQAAGTPRRALPTITRWGESCSPHPPRLSTPPGSLYGRNLVTVTNRAVNPIHHPIKGCDLTPPLVATNQAHARSFQNRTPPKPDLGRQPDLLPWMGAPWLTSSETTFSFREFIIFEGPQSVVRALKFFPATMPGGISTQKKKPPTVAAVNGFE